MYEIDISIIKIGIAQLGTKPESPKTIQIGGILQLLL